MSDVEKLRALYNEDNETNKEFKKSIDELRMLDHSMKQLKDDKKEIIKYATEKYKITGKHINMLIKILNTSDLSIQAEIDELELCQDMAEKLNNLE